MLDSSCDIDENEARELDVHVLRMPIVIDGHEYLDSIDISSEEVNINIGNFINAIINFLLIAFSVFMFVKLINSHKKKEEETKPAPVIANEEKLLTEIRDLLKESK